VGHTVDRKLEWNRTERGITNGTALWPFLVGDFGIFQEQNVKPYFFYIEDVCASQKEKTITKPMEEFGGIVRAVTARRVFEVRRILEVGLQSTRSLSNIERGFY